MQCNAIQYNTIQYNTIQYNTIQYNTIQYNTVQYSTVQYNTVQYSTVQYSTVQYSTVQYSTVQYSAHLQNRLYPLPPLLQDDAPQHDVRLHDERLLVHALQHMHFVPRCRRRRRPADRPVPALQRQRSAFDHHGHVPRVLGLEVRADEVHSPLGRGLRGPGQRLGVVDGILRRALRLVFGLDATLPHRDGRVMLQIPLPPPPPPLWDTNVECYPPPPPRSGRSYYCNALATNGAEHRRYYCNALPASHALVS